MRYSQFASYWQVGHQESEVRTRSALKLSCHNWFYSVNVLSQLSVRTRCSLTVEATLNSSMPESMVRPTSVPNTTGCFTDGLMSHIPGVWQIGWWLISWMWLFWAWNWIWIPELLYWKLAGIQWNVHRPFRDSTLTMAEVSTRTIWVPMRQWLKELAASGERWGN